MTKIALVLVLLAAPGATVAQAPAELESNVVAWTPNDPEPGEPLSVVFNIHVAGDRRFGYGKPVAGVNDVEVVLRGEGQTRRFPTTEVGGGRYTSEIVFPEPGAWHVLVSYGSGSYGNGDEIPLGKGAGRIDGPEPGPPTGQAGSGGFAMRPLVLAGGVLLLAALVGVRRFGRPS